MPFLLSTGLDVDAVFMHPSDAGNWYGAGDSLIVGCTGAYGGAGYNFRCLFRPKVTPPRGSIIRKASLFLTIATDYCTGAMTLVLTCNFRKWIQEQATKDNYATGLAWQSVLAGGALDSDWSAYIGGLAMTGGEAVGSTIEIPLDPLMTQNYIADYPDERSGFTFLTNAESTANRGWAFHGNKCAHSVLYQPRFEFIWDKPIRAID